MRSSNIEHELLTLIRKAKLKFPDVAKEDLISVLNNFKDLQPDVVNFVFPDGISRNCLSLAGTIPIHYKGGKYNIPIALYFLDNHPYNGPYCYVKPTHNMRIRASPTVDTHGRIYLPYLTEWQYPNYDTPGLLQVMTISFQEKCPVYSVGPTSGSGGSTATNNSSGGNSPAPAHTPYPTSANPPYPTASSANNPPYPNTNPPPPYPTADPPPHLMPQPNLIGNSAGSGYPTHTHYQPAVPPPLYPPPLPSSADRSTPTQNAGPTPQLGTGYGTIQPTHIRASLLSAVEDKIRQKLHERMATPFAELQSIDANLKELHSGKQQLREMLDNIGRDRQELERIMGVYTSKKQELERALECANANGAANGTSLNVEDAIDAQTPVHRQILNCYVKDCSIDDTIYCLGQALKRGTVNLPTYLKYVRQLSHQQFEQRLLMQKCRERARLPV